MLNGLLPRGSDWTLLSATDINDHQQVIGEGLLDGELHAYVMQVPAPGCGALLLVASAFRKRRRRRDRH